jgi:predicted lipoprotein with Yx(FWY)xxD motif
MRLVTGLLVIVVLATTGVIVKNLVGRHPVESTRRQLQVSQMPKGITFQTVGRKQDMSVNGSFPGYNVIADARGMTLYTSEQDSPGKSACTGDCAKMWTALSAPIDARSSGIWQVIVRDDGSRQWAFRGKPLYTFAGDKTPGDYKGSTVEGWHFVVNDAMAGVALPDGMSTAEILPAGGQAFVDAGGHVLYVYDGDPPADGARCEQAGPAAAAQSSASGAVSECVNHWRPVLAAETAGDLGDFSAITRPDGIRQWAYQGRMLYTYDLDIEKDDAKGREVDPRWQVALAERYFQPANIGFAPNIRGVDMLVDNKGMTIYARDRFVYQSGGFSLRGGQKGDPELGKALGALACPAECTKKYPPVLAPDGALPSGYWDVITRPDGRKQWSFNGYVLYTYVGDKDAGDESSQDEFDLSLGRILPPTPSPIDAVSALFWREVTF